MEKCSETLLFFCLVFLLRVSDIVWSAETVIVGNDKP